MKLVSWNVNGLRSAIGKEFPNFISATNPDIVCLQETKIHSDALIPPHQIFDFYSAHHAFASTRKGYSGVTTLTKNSGAFAIANHTPGFGVEEFDNEGRALICDYGPILLYNTYFPSGTSGEVRQNFKYSFLNQFAAHISQLSAKDRKRLVICGDFNICHKDIDIHHPREAERLKLTGFLPEERKWMDEFCELGFVDSYRHVHGEKPASYTWWSFRANSRAKNLGWRLDYFFVSKELKSKVVAAEIFDQIGGSDHCPIALELSVS